ncbi:MFS transporter [Bauldia litoralis]|uniref:Predicted arabinose efflux permease, MFS family n=1 Tax=Bauldia litoralis TaxID=665467 RepID=A0A1G6B1T2_9HYPH|nr:MFS transporter [Bauldia litoralis]SDB14542.1 Predicted arabinose efflux permease, MFS family [Bauldia litoralis]
MTDQALDSSVVSEDPHARRNAFVLSAAAAINGGIPPIAITLGGLAGIYLLGPDKSLATLPVSGFNLGVALGAIPAALLMREIGRRYGFMSGTLFAVLGGIVSAIAVILGQFWILFAGFLCVGLATSFVQQYRFAAADSGDEAFRAKAISWVMMGGIAAAIIGPQTVIFTRNLLQPIPFAGAFFAMSVLAVIGLGVLTLLSGSAREAPKRVEVKGGRSLAEIARQPRFVVAVLCAMGSYALMALVMTAAPLAMVACGLGEDNAALGIQWHVLAMFGPSFFTGRLIARFGAEAIITVGMALLAGCAAVALSGIALAHFWIALILLGVGWNFGFIGATAMLTQTYRPEERSKVQGLNDFLVFGTVATASFGSGSIFSSFGWDWINLAVFPVVVVCVLGVAVAVFSRRRMPV